MKNIFKNNLGFTLLEIMIAAGIGSVIVLFAVTQLKSTNKTVGTSLISNESAFLQNLVIANMSNPVACGQTFATFPVTRSNFPLKNKTGNNFLEVNQEISNDPTKKLFKITAISSKADPVSAKNLLLTIEYEINSKLDRVAKKALNSFTIDVYVKKSGANVENCFFDSSDMIKKAVRASCWGTAATYDPGDGQFGTCKHNVALDGVTVTATAVCPAGQFLKTSKNTATGVNFICEKYTTAPPCPSGQLLSGISATGAAICQNITDLFSGADGTALVVTAPGVYTTVDLNCDSDHVLQRVWPKQCAPKVITKNCAPGQYISNVDNAGNVTCSYFTRKGPGACPAGTYLTGVNSDGSGQTCTGLTLPATCPAGTVLSAVNSSGNAAFCQNVSN